MAREVLIVGSSGTGKSTSVSKLMSKETFIHSFEIETNECGKF